MLLFDDDDDVDELFGNANRWLKEESLDENVEEIEKKPRRKLTKIEEGIKSSKVTKTEKKLEFLGSSCIYPRMAPQPMKESCLLTSELEKTNEAYALAKISGLKYCEFLNRQYGTDYISVMPTNLYGPNDNYHPTHSHVLPALIRRFHEAKVEGKPYVTCWGDGSPLREFLYVDDLANLCVFLMNSRFSSAMRFSFRSSRFLRIRICSPLSSRSCSSITVRKCASCRRM